MRIAQLAPLAESVPPKLYGGTERVVVWLVDELVDLGHEVTLFASGDSLTKGKLHPVWPQALRLGRRGVDPNAACCLPLEATAKRASEFDVIHSHIDWLPLPLLSRSKTPFLTTVHGRLDLPGLPDVVREFSEEGFVSISNNQRRQLPEAQWIATIHHGLPSSLFQASYDQGSYLAFLGRLTVEKGPEDAIRIAEAAGMPLRIAAKIPRAETAYFKKQLQPHIDGKRVTLVGEVDEAKKQPFLSGAAALLFPIDWPEPFGLVMIEAMACGTPVIAYRSGLRAGSHRGQRHRLCRRWRGRRRQSAPRATKSRPPGNPRQVRGALHSRPDGERVRRAVPRARHRGGNRGARRGESIGQMKGQLMWSRTANLSLVLVAVLAAGPALSAELSPEAINSAEPSKKLLSKDKATPAGVRLQVLLDRAHFSPGEIDGKFGENARKALRAYAEAEQLPSADRPTEEVWKALRADERPVTSDYTITEKDVAGPFLEKLPSKMEDMKDIPKLGYTSPREAIAEKFHMSEQLLAAVNPGKKFDRAGEAIVVVDTGGAEGGEAAKADRIEVDKTRQTVKLFDKSNALVGFYPATVGSEEKPSPSGTLKVTEVSRNPTYRYNPDYHFKGVRTDKPFTIKPGPNNPVGTIWISLSAEGYGIHGTPEPGKVSKAESHGCVRLTNWDAERVAASVVKGTPVEFAADHR